MCWSAPVSAGFALAEWAGILYLMRRNQALDRAFAIAVIPIAAQETLQWYLWENIATRPDACNQANAVTSLLVKLIIGLVPLCWVWFARFFSTKDAARTHWSAVLLWWVTVLFVLVRSSMLVYAFFAGPQQCTTVGPNHHQVWGDLLAFYRLQLPWLDWVFFHLYSGLPIAALLLLFRPFWLALSISLLGGGTLTLSLWLLSVDEFGSVWCWSCSLLLLLGVIAPFVKKLK